MFASIAPGHRSASLAAFLILGGLVHGAPQDDGVVGPGPVPYDSFHPDRDKPVTPLWGGRVIVHLEAMPKHMCYPIENSAMTRRMLYEVHETLLIQDWEYHDYRPRVARAFSVEDLLVLADAARERYAGTEGVIDAKVRVEGAEEGAEHTLVRALYGQVEAVEGGWRVTPLSRGSALPAPVTIPEADVAGIERGTVFTFELRDDVLWHPSLVFQREHPEAYRRLAGHKLDAADVLFSWKIYLNPKVDCDEKRFQFVKVTHGEIVDPLTVRFFYESQYAGALGSLGDSLAILPAHVYDLSDPDNPEHREAFSEDDQARHINENPHNQLWVGLGPYRVTEWNSQYVQAERFTDEQGKCLYFDRSNAGYVDTIRWRAIVGDETAMNALLNGELDFFERVKSSDYFGERTEGGPFEKELYKGYKYLGAYTYLGWNLYRPQLKELAVRKALAMAIDLPAYLETVYKGLARQVTGPFPYNSAAYDHTVEPLPYDVEGAIELLEEAGWYDRNGDGVRDKNGVELAIDFLMPAENDASTSFGLKLQESYARIQVQVDIVPKEWATLLEDFKSRNFDSINLSWVPPLESDPEQLWHSRYGKYDVRGSNISGVTDSHVDELIRRGQRELDSARRMEVWHELHRYLYEEVQPYLFLFNVPRKFGMTRRLRGFQAVAIDPGYVLRRWYFWDPAEPGTRRTLDR